MILFRKPTSMKMVSTATVIAAIGMTSLTGAFWIEGTSVAGASPLVVSCVAGEYNILTGITKHLGVLDEVSFQGPTTDSSATQTMTSTRTFSASVTGTVNVDFIFSSLTAQISGGIQQSASADYGSTYVVSVPAGKTLYVAYVDHWVAFSGYTENVSSTCQTSDVSNYSGTAPQGFGWVQSNSRIQSY